MPSTCKHCKVIHILESQKQFVALITFTESEFDLQLTDATDAWSGQGCRLGNRGNPLRGFTPAEWLSRAQDALCAATPSTSYKFRVEHSNPLKLRWTWQEEGLDFTAWVDLTPATPPGPLISSILLELAGSYSTVRAAVGELDGQLSTMQQQLASKDAALRAEIEKRLEKERGLFLKFAELLNKKKSKLEELQQRVAELEAAVEQLRAAAQDAPEQDTDEEQLQQELMAVYQDPAYGADTEDDEEDVQEGRQQQQEEARERKPDASTAAGPSTQGQQPQRPVSAGLSPGLITASAAGSTGPPGSRAGSLQQLQGVTPTPAEQQPQWPTVVARAAAPAADASRQQEPGGQQEPLHQQQLQQDFMDAATQPIPDELLPQELLKRRQQKSLPAPGAHTSPAAALVPTEHCGDHARQQQQQQREEGVPQARYGDDDPLGLAGLLPGDGAAAGAGAGAAQPKIRKRTRR